MNSVRTMGDQYPLKEQNQPEGGENVLNTEEFRNSLEIQFFGLQRSGNHAVLAWLIQQFDEPVVFLNNVMHFHDPFLDFRAADLPNSVRVRPGSSSRGVSRLERLRCQRKNVLVYSYENFPIGRLATVQLVDNREQKIGRSEAVRRVLLIRDFFNWVASIIRFLEQSRSSVPTVRRVEGLIHLWLMYAREYLGETCSMRDAELVPISFNRWIGDGAYRAGLLDRLCIPLKDNSNKHVPRAGGGSSFDGVVFSGCPEMMHLHERWRYILEDKFLELRGPIERRRKEIDFYNKRIFNVRAPY